MSEAVKRRVLFYFVIAVVCYAIAVYSGSGRWAFIVFAVAGVIAELVFWRNLFLRWKER